MTIRVEAIAKDDERFVTTTEDTFAIDVPAKKIVVVRARVADDGDLAWSWKRKGRGTYKLRLDVSVEAKARPAADKVSQGTRQGGWRAAR